MTRGVVGDHGKGCAGPARRAMPVLMKRVLARVTTMSRYCTTLRAGESLRSYPNAPGRPLIRSGPRSLKPKRLGLTAVARDMGVPYLEATRVAASPDRA